MSNTDTTFSRGQWFIWHKKYIVDTPSFIKTLKCNIFFPLIEFKITENEMGFSLKA